MQVTRGELCNQTAESGLNHRESHDLCLVVIPRHKTLGLTFSEFHLSPFFIINGPWRWEIICKYCNSKQTGGGLPDERGVLSRDLLGINVIVRWGCWTVSEGTFLAPRTSNAQRHAALTSLSRARPEHSSKVRRVPGEKRRPSSLIKSLLSIQGWLSKYWSQCEHQLLLMGQKTGKKLLDFVKFGKMSCFSFCKKKENMKPSPVGPLLTCHHTNK